MGRARTRATEIVDNVDRRPKRQWGPATTTARARGLRAKTSAGRERTVPPSCGKECRRGVGTTATGTRRSEARGAKTWTPAVAASRLDTSPRCLQALVLEQCCSCGWVPGSVHTAWNPSTTTHVWSAARRSRHAGIHAIRSHESSSRKVSSWCGDFPL